MASNIALLPNLTAEGNLARYLNEIQKLPNAASQRRIYVSEKMGGA